MQAGRHVGKHAGGQAGRPASRQAGRQAALVIQELFFCVKDFSKFFGPSPRKQRLTVYRGLQVAVHGPDLEAHFQLDREKAVRHLDFQDISEFSSPKALGMQDLHGFH